MKKKPCMYFGFNACTMGDTCPYLRDPNNKYSGPKPKGLAKKEEASSSAGAATIVAEPQLLRRFKVQEPRLRWRTLQARGQFGMQRNGVQRSLKIKEGFQSLVCLRKH